MSILDVSKMLMYKFWQDYFKAKYGDRVKLCYTDTGSFVINIITEDFFQDISNDVEKWFDTLTRLTMINMIKDLFQYKKIKKYQVFLKMNWEEK